MAFEIDGHEFTEAERRVMHDVLLAQLDDVHAGGVYMWDETKFETALAVMSKLTGEDVGPEPEEGPMTFGPSLSSRVLIISFCPMVYDLDHPDLKDEEWAEGERMMEILSAEFGR